MKSTYLYAIFFFESRKCCFTFQKLIFKKYLTFSLPRYHWNNKHFLRWHTHTHSLADSWLSVGSDCSLCVGLLVVSAETSSAEDQLNLTSLSFQPPKSFPVMAAIDTWSLQRERKRDTYRC